LVDVAVNRRRRGKTDGIGSARIIEQFPSDGARNRAVGLDGVNFPTRIGEPKA
jgi:hypothetical protein